jgi:hypothetical protein
MRLLTLDIEGINKLVVEYERESKALKDEIFRICWYMRGGVTYTECLELIAFEDREIIGNIVEKNLETTKESGLPFF